MEKLRVLNSLDIMKIIDMKIVINAVEKAYIQKTNKKGSVWPLVYFEYEHDVYDLDIRSGNLDDDNVFGLKLISYNEKNPQNNLPKVYGTAIIFNATSGEPIALLNAAPITMYRTGAAAAVGAKYLANKESTNLLVVGCGNVAIHAIAATLITMPNIKNVYICNPKNNKTVIDKFNDIKIQVNKLLEEANCCLDANLIYAENLEETTKISDIIITATSSYNAMIKEEWVKEGTHFSCMGACIEGQQEIDEKIFLKSRRYADDIEQCLKFGEAQKAFENNLIRTFDGEIGEIISNEKIGRQDTKEITIFDSTGLFIQDLATAIELLKKAEQNNIGKMIDL